jgi:Na+/H+ antiporter NhaD/arsenite permease-like protein
MIPARYATILFGLLLSGMMSAIVSGIATLRALGPVEGFAGLWFTGWLSSWLVAFPAVLVVAPIARRAVARLTRAE